MWKEIKKIEKMDFCSYPPARAQVNTDSIWPLKGTKGSRENAKKAPFLAIPFLIEIQTLSRIISLNGGILFVDPRLRRTGAGGNWGFGYCER